MTNLKEVNIGQNKYCGPAILSILTGKSTDECASVISKINGSYNVVGVLLSDLLYAASRLGFEYKTTNTNGSLYRTLTSLASEEGMYIVTLSGHFVCIEVKDKKIYFCDNHTKEPIPAASSARLMQRVIAYSKVWKKENFVEEQPKPKPICIHNKGTVYCLGCGRVTEVNQWIRLTLTGDSFEVYGTEGNLAKLSRFIVEMSSERNHS